MHLLSLITHFCHVKLFFQCTVKSGLFHTVNKNLKKYHGRVFGIHLNLSLSFIRDLETRAVYRIEKIYVQFQD